jgi:peptidoglycan hydrolase-like protein with peptidoglycan-binding domain
MKFREKITSLFLAVVVVTAFFIPLNVQAIPVDKQYISQNRSYQYLEPQGLVIHDTCAPGGTAQNNHDYFNRVCVASSAHYFADWTKVIQCVPDNEQAWHAGPYANHRYLSIEMCNPGWHNQEQFNSVYQNTVELAVQLCKQYGWNSNNIVSHAYISNTFHETDHEDPIFFLQSYGKTWDMLLNDIQKSIDGQTVQAPSVPQVSNVFNVERAARFVGTRCLELQQKLISLSYNCGGYGADGQFGNGTYNSLIAFQRDNNLEADGLAGNVTFSKLNELIEIKDKPTQPTVSLNTWVARLQKECNLQGFSNQTIDGIPGANTLNGCPLLKIGDSGTITKLLQEKLQISADGFYGNQTRQAVIKFQKSYGLYADGIVGKQTWRVLLGL